MYKIRDGYIMLARKITESEIWLKKPAWWLKVWEYILMEVNHKTNKEFPRGTNFFNCYDIHYTCKLHAEGLKVKSVHNVVDWLKKRKMIKTRKTTRGIIITVCNYETYQRPSAYIKDTEKDTGKEMERKQKGNGKDTINNNDKNDNNDITLTSKWNDRRHPDIQTIIDYAKEKKFPMQGSQRFNRIWAFNCWRHKGFDDKPLGIDVVKRLIDIANACRGEPFSPQVNDFKQMFYRWADLLAFVDKKKRGGQIG